MYPQVFGKYVLERELATGGMARVTLATLRGAGGFEKRLVVKQIRDELAIDHEFVQRFVEEAKTTVALSHPNIVPVYELGIELGTYYLAMELVDGVSVDRLLTKQADGHKAGLTPEEGAYIGAEICRALDYAHRRMQVVHRDITPRNVMVDQEGQVKLIDFGIAARASVAGQDVFGTPGHMAPEQLRREEISPATDVFAVAVLLMELWSGRPPFRRKTPAESLAQMHAPHPKPSEVDLRLGSLDAIIASSLSMSKADRPQHADDLGRALRKFLQDIDQGDVERGLGERVREAKAKADAKANRLKDSSSLVKPSRPSVPDMGPRTFAMRSEVEAWRAETPSHEEVHGTRRLPPSTPPLARDPEEEAPKIETVATKPIETPVRREEPPAKRTGGRGWAMAAGIVATVSLGAYWLLMRPGQDVERPATGTALSTSIPTLIPTPASTLASTPTSTPTSASTPAPTPTPASTSPSEPPSTSAPVGTGQLLLVGDPGTEVSIDDAPPRPCPAAITVKAGPHRVRFSFGYATTHDSIGKQVVVAPNDRVTVRADFTSATPRIRIER